MTFPDRLPPYSENGEMGILGCLLLDPQACIPIAQTRMTSEAFYDMRFQAIYEEIMAQFEEKRHVDLLTFQQRLKDKNQLEALGGMAFISGLMNSAPAPSAIEHYISIVVEKFTLRRMIQLCTETVLKCYSGGEDAKSALNDLQREVMGMDPALGISEDITMKELMDRVGERIDGYKTPEKANHAIPTGFRDLDKIFGGGVKRGQLIIIAARPSIGKSSLAFNIVENIAETGVPCGVFSMEMEAEELGERSVANASGIDGEQIQQGDFNDEEARAMMKAIVERGKLPIHICDKGGMTFNYFRARLRRMVQRQKIKMAVIDYLQLFVLPSRENRSIEIGTITAGLKMLAKELSIPIICLSQLNRDLEKDGRKPRLSDLRDSGSIEQDADKVLMLSEDVEAPKTKKKKASKDDRLFNRTGESEEDEKPLPPHTVKIVGDVPKNRGGKRGTMLFLFRKQFTRFENMPLMDEAEYAQQGGLI